MAQINPTEKLMFTKNLGVMIGAGIPLAEALYTLEKDAKNPSLAKLIRSIKLQVESGKALSLSLTKFPKVFDKVYLNLITIGEQSGTLDETLKFLAEQLTKLHVLKKKIQGAMMYPLLVVGVMFTIGIGLSLFVLPKLVDFFAAFDQKLPLSTRILLGFANLMKNHGILVVSIFVGIIIGFNLVIKIPFVKKWWDKIIFHLPIFGNFLHESAMAELSRNMSVLLKSGVPIIAGLATLIESQSNTHIQDSLRQLQLGLSKGKKMGDTIESSKLTVFPSLFSKMIAVGERTGKLDEMLSYLAEYYDEEIEDLSKNLTTILEPVLLVIVGLMVGFMAIAIIGPIYQITGSIGG
ncbi:MAG: type II secretion system F family protein [bacterium]